MRRIDRAITAEDAKEILASGEYGVLSLTLPDSNPYGVPLNYAYEHPHIYFHCATEGTKLEAIRANPNVSFCVVGKTRVLPEKFSTEYESVIATGVAEEVTGPQKADALMMLVRKYSPDFVEDGAEYVARASDSTGVFRVRITELSGKARR